jgi:hypothetical protein
MTDLSPAADAVLDAYMTNCGWLDGPLEKDYRCAAAVLRAALNQLVPEYREHYPATLDERYRKVSAFDVRNQFLAIAAELENTNG